MTDETVAKWIFFTLMILSMGMISIADTNVKTIKEKPLIINTVAQHYENPTLGEYQLCTQSRDACIDKCADTDEKCQSKCPICPILLDQPVLMQGINDTEYRLPTSATRGNQTNIIRVTNQIHNIIDTNLGNITANNQNNISIYQNKTSYIGGKFGLGYNEKGPCCHLIDVPQRCQRSISNPNCAHRRQRSCGSHCISRVMRAKQVVSCSDTNPTECSQEVEYVPQNRRPGCQYTSRWPFINCKTSTQHIVRRRRTSCSRCYGIPYMYVMRRQVPRQCIQCFGRTGGHQPILNYQPHYGANGYYPMYSPYPSYQPYYPPPAYDYNFNNNDDNADEFELRDLDWKVEEQKCVNEDGTIKANCTDATDISENPNLQPNEPSNDEYYDTEGELDYENDDYDSIYRPTRRYRRNN